LSQNDTQQVEELEAEISAQLALLPQRGTESIRSVRRQFSKRLANVTPELVVQLAFRLIDRSDTIYRFFAYELVHHHKQALRSLNAAALGELGRGIDNWGAVDTFACYLAGPAWREQQVSDSLIKSWARSRDRWWRRAALVSTVPLNNKARGGRGDPLRTLKICEMLVRDRDVMVVKALSWALRELAKRDPKSVREFLVNHEAVLAPLVYREVNNKLSTGLKNPRRTD
jgi:3-methyladenine DNA glycosylase AlkD